MAHRVGEAPQNKALNLTSGVGKDVRRSQVNGVFDVERHVTLVE